MIQHTRLTVFLFGGRDKLLFNVKYQVSRNEINIAANKSYSCDRSSRLVWFLSSLLWVDESGEHWIHSLMLSAASVYRPKGFPLGVVQRPRTWRNATESIQLDTLIFIQRLSTIDYHVSCVEEVTSRFFRTVRTNREYKWVRTAWWTTTELAQQLIQNSSFHSLLSSGISCYTRF